VQYLGGKHRQAKHIAAAILPRVRDRRLYLEPFLGGGSTFKALSPHFAQAVGADYAADLMMMWDAARRGWLPPPWVSREEYESLRTAPPSPLRGFVGFGCSFGGKWFGGYGAQVIDAKHPSGHVSHGSQRSVVDIAQCMRGALLATADYRLWSPGPETVVYCDPPYRNATSGYPAPVFDSVEFWDTCRRWAANGAAVFVSERTAPPDMEEIWSRTAAVSLARETNAARNVERLYRVERE